MVFDCTFGVRILRRLTFGLLLLCICLTAILLGLVLGWHFKHRTPSPVESNRHCLACDDLQPRLYNSLGTDKDKTALRQRRNTSQCCGAFSNVMQLLIKKEMSLQFYQTSTADSSNVGESFIKDCDLKVDIKTPKAKLVGVVNSVASFLVQGHSKLRWNKNSRTFTANNCIHLELEGEIFIKTPGYYIVSSTLNVNATRRNNSIATFSHNVNIFSHKFGTTGVLMQRQRSIKESGNGVFTSYMSAVFKLHIYDRISVSVSHPEYITIDSSADNFIAYYTYDFY